jgi:hypothetical protein
MGNDWNTTIVHLDLLKLLAERLSGYHLTIYSFQYNQLAFGSFTLEIGTRHTRREYIWDCKEYILKVINKYYSDSSFTGIEKTSEILSKQKINQENVFELILINAKGISDV